MYKYEWADKNEEKKETLLRCKSLQEEVMGAQHNVQVVFPEHLDLAIADLEVSEEDYEHCPSP